MPCGAHIVIVRPSVRQIYTHTVSISLAVSISTRYNIASFFHIIRFTLAVVAVVVHRPIRFVSGGSLYILSTYSPTYVYGVAVCRFASSAAVFGFSQFVVALATNFQVFNSIRRINARLSNVLYIVRTASHQYPSIGVCMRSMVSVNAFWLPVLSSVRAAIRNDIFVRHFQSVNATRCQ